MVVSLLFSAMLAHAAPPVRLGCPELASPEVPYNGIDDDCDGATADDDLDGDNAPLADDGADDDPDVQSDLVEGSLEIDGPLPELCPDDGPYALQGDLIIVGGTTALSGLHCIQAVHGKLVVDPTARLTDLQGLESLQSIGGLVVIDAITLGSLRGLTGLREIKGDAILRNLPRLKDLSGLDHLVRVRGDLRIEQTGITSMRGLNALGRVDGDLSVAQSALTRMDGLKALRVVDGSMSFSIAPMLTRFDGPPRLWTIGTNLAIGRAAALELIDGFDELVSVQHGIQLTTLPALDTIEGFDSLTAVRDGVTLVRTDALEDLGPLEDHRGPLDESGSSASLLLAIAAGVVVMLMTLVAGMGLVWFRRRPAQGPPPVADAELPEALQRLPETERADAARDLTRIELVSGRVLADDASLGGVLWVTQGALTATDDEGNSRAIDVGGMVGSVAAVTGVSTVASVRVERSGTALALRRDGYLRLAAAGSRAAHLIEDDAHSRVIALLDEALVRLEQRRHTHRHVEPPSTYARATAAPLSPVDALAASSAFQDANPHVLLDLVACGQARATDAGQVLWREGDLIGGAAVILSGAVDVIGRAGAGEVHLAVVGQGTVLGIGCAYSARRQLTTARARGTVAWLELPIDELRSYGRRDHALGSAIRAAVVRDLLDALVQVESR